MKKNKFSRCTAPLLLCGLFLAQPTAAYSADKKDPLDVEADSLRYLKEQDTVEATGDVVVKSEEHGNIRTDSVRYNRKTGALSADGNITFTDSHQKTIQTQHLEIDEDLQTGETSSLLILLDPEKSTHIRADSATKDGDIFLFKNPIYSACPLPDDLKTAVLKEGNTKKAKKPVWQIRSNEARLNAEEDIIIHKNMWFDLYGQPIFWLPWMRHAATNDKALSGLLRPEVATSGNRGAELKTAFYWRQSERFDATIGARYMSKRGLLLSGEQRFLVGNTEGQIEAGFIDDDELNNTRSYVRGAAEHVFNPGQRLGLNVQRASDDTFYDDFLGYNPNFLTSEAYFEDTTPEQYFGLRSAYYQDTRANNPSNLTPQPFLDAQFKKEFTTNRQGERLFLDTSLLTLGREAGQDVRRFIAKTGWLKHVATHGGHLFDLEANVRGDVYNIDATSNTWEAQVTPEVALTWQNPLVSSDGKHTVTPIVKAIGTTTNNNTNIPNEDATTYELDAANLFENNRFAGEDRIENGIRVIYGLENSWTRNHSQTLNLFLGQSWHTESDNTFNAGSGHSTKLSDWVGQARLQSGIFSFTNRFRLNKDNLDPRRVDSFFNVGTPGDTNLGLIYSFEKGQIEELRGYGRWQINNAWALTGSWQQDLRNSVLLQAESGIAYKHCCYEVSLTVRRRGFDNRNVEPSTDFILNFSLLTLGRDERKDD